MYRLVAVLLFFLFVHIGAETPSFQVSFVDQYVKVQQCNKSVLWEVRLKNDENGTAPYRIPILLIDLHGSYYQRGYDYGYLLGKASVYDFYALVESVISNKYEQEVAFAFLDWQWKDFLSKQVPFGYLEELRGVSDAGRDLGLKDHLDVLFQRGITLANFPGDVTQNIKWLIIHELEKRFHLREHISFFGMNQFVTQLTKNLESLRLRCSMFGVWGSRTKNSTLYSMRNLDWLPNSGINANKLVTVFHDEELPVEDGNQKHAYATLGFAGLLGSLAGMNDAGLTVHEAGNDVKRETFLGFPWVLRLRHVLGNAANLKEALLIWQQTNNTLGMNHGIGSASDQRFVALETMAGYTAMFFDNDPREANYTVVDSNTGQTVRMGWPLKNAVYRTNHGFDPTVVSQELKQPQPTSDSAVRYKILHDAFTYYENKTVLIDDLQAINITSILGDKGSNFFVCPKDSSGINVLSVTFRPKEKLMYVAFEEGGKSSSSPYKPACCSSYVFFDMNKWFNT